MEEQNEKKWFEAEFVAPKQEAISLAEGSNYFTVLDEGREVSVPSIKDASVQVTKRVFTVMPDGMSLPKAWWIPVGKSSDSYYSQVVAVAKARGGLTGAKLHVYRLGKGIRTRYKVELVSE